MVAVSLAALSPIHIIRISALRFFGATIDGSATIYHGFKARGIKGISIGARTSIGDGASLDGRGGLRLGRDVNVSTEVQIWTAQHDWRSTVFAYVEAPVSVGDKCWLGPRVIVLPGATIGEGTVVAAGAVVKGTLEPYSLYGGVPAKKLADRPSELDYQLSGSGSKPWWW